MPRRQRRPRVVRRFPDQHIRTADLQRLAQQFAGMRIVVDDEQLEMSVHGQVDHGHDTGRGGGTSATDVHDLHDPGLRDSRALGRLLPGGVVMLDASQDCRYANPVACQLLGAADETALRDRWESIRTHLGLVDLGAIDPQAPLQKRVDLPQPIGTRPLRIEVHPLGQDVRAGYVLLLRDRGCLDRADRIHLMASEARASRHVLAGLVHEAKGPLNNFHLTLALLRSAIERIDPHALAEATLARWRRYLEVLRTEAVRLSDCVNDIHASSVSGNGGRETLDVGVLLRDVARVLRHDATMHEARLAIELPPEPARVAGDSRQLQLALLGFTVSVLDATPAGGVLTLRMHASDERTLQVRIAATPGTLPPHFATEMFRLACANESDYPAAIAGRLIIEAHGGDVTLDASGGAGIVVTLPALAH